MGVYATLLLLRQLDIRFGPGDRRLGGLDGGGVAGGIDPIQEMAFRKQPPFLERHFSQAAVYVRVNLDDGRRLGVSGKLDDLRNIATLRLVDLDRGYRRSLRHRPAASGAEHKGHRREEESCGHARRIWS